MPRKPNGASDARVGMPTYDQVSAGGVAVRFGRAGAEVALVSVGPRGRWQLPKGLVDPGETPEAAAVREEAGIETDVVAPIDTIEYWYVGRRGGGRVRFHKRVHFFLLAYRAGRVSEHDREVNEARWVLLERAKALLAFANERRVVARAEAMIAERGR